MSSNACPPVRWILRYPTSSRYRLDNARPVQQTTMSDPEAAYEDPFGAELGAFDLVADSSAADARQERIAAARKQARTYQAKVEEPGVCFHPSASLLTRCGIRTAALKPTSDRSGTTRCRRLLATKTSLGSPSSQCTTSTLNETTSKWSKPAAS